MCFYTLDSERNTNSNFWCRHCVVLVTTIDSFLIQKNVQGFLGKNGGKIYFKMSPVLCISTLTLLDYWNDFHFHHTGFLKIFPLWRIHKDIEIISESVETLSCCRIFLQKSLYNILDTSPESIVKFLYFTNKNKCKQHNLLLLFF